MAAAYRCAAFWYSRDARPGGCHVDLQDGTHVSLGARALGTCVP
ncbi:hypothetical protein BH24ACT15_BH24ACT15_32780 [soil metagenome]